MHKYSIIVPSCDVFHLKESIGSLVKLTDFRISDAEVIVVLNGCEPEAKQYIDSLGPHFSYIWHDSRIGVCKAMNIGVAASSGEYVLKMDDDCILLDWGANSHWLKLLEEPFKNRLVGQTGTIMDYYPTQYRKPYYSLMGCLVMTTRSIWDEVGGLDEAFSPGIGEDTDFSFKIQDLGYKLALVGSKHEHKDGMFINDYPLYHKSLANYNTDTQELIKRNQALLDKKYSTSNPI